MAIKSDVFEIRKLFVLPAKRNLMSISFIGKKNMNVALLWSLRIILRCRYSHVSFGRKGGLCVCVVKRHGLK